MTAYAASSGTAAGTAKVTIVPSSAYQVRIARVEVFGSETQPGTNISYTVNVYPGITPTGGSSITPLAMRSGAPASTATVKTGATISGTNALLHSEVVSLSSTAAGGDVAPMNSNYNFPFDLIVASGSTFVVSFTKGAGLGTGTVVVYYEELRLAWSG